MRHQHLRPRYSQLQEANERSASKGRGRRKDTNSRRKEEDLEIDL
jgi:hypothetical protein